MQGGKGTAQFCAEKVQFWKQIKKNFAFEQLKKLYNRKAQ